MAVTPQSEIKQLIARYSNGEPLSNAEVAKIAGWLQHTDAEGFNEITEDLQQPEIMLLSQQSSLEVRLDAIDRETKMPTLVYSSERAHRIHFIKRLRWIAAAIFIMAMVLTGWLLMTKNPQTYRVTAKTDVKAPVSNRATVKLASGRVIFLDEVKNGQLAKLDSVSLVKRGDGQVVYSGTSGKIEFNTINNPRGSKVIVIELTDGTHVWLNSGSSMTYPVPFETDARNVSITGEAYFEVAKNKDKPFIVSTPTDRIEVLGTHFNINSYPDETGVRTTLLEGSVKIGTAFLKPGEQYMHGKITSANTGAAVAWVHGYFQFEHADIKTVIRQLSRWYDVDVRYEGSPSTELFGGEIPRELSLLKVLKAVSETGIHYSMDGKTLVIQP